MPPSLESSLESIAASLSAALVGLLEREPSDFPVELAEPDFPAPAEPAEPDYPFDPESLTDGTVVALIAPRPLLVEFPLPLSLSFCA